MKMPNVSTNAAPSPCYKSNGRNARNAGKANALRTVFGDDAVMIKAINSSGNVSHVFSGESLEISRSRCKSTTVGREDWNDLAHKIITPGSQTPGHQSCNASSRVVVLVRPLEYTPKATEKRRLQFFAEMYVIRRAQPRLLNIVVYKGGMTFASNRGSHPRWIARIVINMLCNFLQLGQHLDPRGTIADDGDAFAARVEIGIPV